MIEVGGKTYLSESALIDHVRELEAENRLWRAGEKAQLSTEWELTDRIKKAREILTTPSGAWDSEGKALSDKIERALAALEGKDGK